MSADLPLLVAHLEAETAWLRELLASLDDAGWHRATPAAGWTVADQVSHLAYFDEAATASLGGRFAPYEAALRRHGAALCDVVAEQERRRPPAELAAWLDAARAALCEALRASDPAARSAWFGPPLSTASMASGRIMETWAHGQDVADGCGVEHPATAALYDVARLCARTRANSYAARGRSAPDTPVLVELTAPDGARWRFGDEGGEAIAGDAVEFCLVATQRRHVDDTGLIASGPAAREWLEIAQAFAGPPGAGRAPTRAAR